jgi:hypothetical protein
VNAEQFGALIVAQSAALPAGPYFDTVRNPARYENFQFTVHILTPVSWKLGRISVEGSAKIGEVSNPFLPSTRPEEVKFQQRYQMRNRNLEKLGYLGRLSNCSTGGSAITTVGPQNPRFWLG